MPKPSVPFERLEIGTGEGLVWLIGAIALPFTPFLGPIGDASLLVVKLATDSPVGAGLGLLVAVGLLTWWAKASPDGLSVRAWVLGAWLAGLYGITVLVALALDAVLTSNAFFLLPFIAIAVWAFLGLVVSPLVMGVALAFASRLFVAGSTRGQAAGV